MISAGLTTLSKSFIRSSWEKKSLRFLHSTLLVRCLPLTNPVNSSLHLPPSWFSVLLLWLTAQMVFTLKDDLEMSTSGNLYLRLLWQAQGILWHKRETFDVTSLLILVWDWSQDELFHINPSRTTCLSEKLWVDHRRGSSCVIPSSLHQTFLVWSPALHIAFVNSFVSISLMLSPCRERIIEKTESYFYHILESSGAWVESYYCASLFGRAKNQLWWRIFSCTFVLTIIF